MFQPVDPKPVFPELEQKILKYWQQNEIFEKQVSQRSENNKYVFYDGPPFITGLPHYGHLLGSISKDAVPRYQAMKGKRVERIWGWDCHGLPIENKVEKKLGLRNRRDIEDLGIGKFIEECYSYTREVSEEWKWYIDRIGRWVDMDKSYRTMDQDYMESVMWVFKQLSDKNLIYEGTRTSLFCTRCGTPVSNFEIAMDNSYADMEDPTVTIKFKLKNETNTYMLAWTTTPWTLPSNRGLAVEEEGKYVKVKIEYKLKPVRKGASAIVYNPKKNQFLVLQWDRDKALNIKSLVQGGIEDGETAEECILREVTEETGYNDLKLVKKIGTNEYQIVSGNSIANKHYEVFLVELQSGKQQKQVLQPDEKFELEWIDADQIVEKLTFEGSKKFATQALAHYGLNSEKVEEVSDQKLITQNDIVEYIILGKEKLETVMTGVEYEIVEEMSGKDLVGLEYEPLYDFIPGNENDFKVYSYPGMVNAEEGVGIVHSAPGFGEIDSEMGQHHGLTMMMTINDEGKFVPEISKFAGLYYKNSNRYVVHDLISRNLLFNYGKIVHRYPFCYRCETPLIYKSQPSWFIDVKSLKSKLIENNKNINWVPEHLKEGRFGKGLETAPDWCISRSRYWGTPMPVWQAVDANGKVTERVVIGSRDELMKRNDQITKLIFIRHAIRDKTGTTPDASLTDEGRKQALELSERLSDINPDVILSSSMARCIETIEPYAKSKGVEIIIDERFGSATRKEILTNVKKEYEAEYITDLSEANLQKSLESSFAADSETIRDICEKYKGKTIVIATHGEVIASFRHLIEGGTFLSEMKRAPEYAGNYTTYMFGGKLLDLHRPVIDSIELKSTNGNILKRVPETLDVWMESASMPYAQIHYPFENKIDFEANFPADYISEYIAQTRAWFYVMHVISTALFDKNSFKNVVTTGVIMGNDGRKMSKSFGNYPDPKGVLESYGGDALRMYLLRTPLLKGENVDVSEDMIKGQIRDISLPIWNTFSFFVTYANIHNWNTSDQTNPSSEHPLDKWIIERFAQYSQNLQSSMDSYDLPGAANSIPDFITDLSKWYIRRSRDRFRDGDKNALNTLYYILKNFVITLAPFTPFLAEEIYQALDLSQNSVHLLNLENFEVKNSKILQEMEVVRKVSSIGQSLRVENGLKLRQPLQRVEIKSDTKLENWALDIIKDELNVKETIQTQTLQEISGFITTSSDGVELALDTNLTPELKTEGLVREIVRNIQAIRKKSGLKFGEMVDFKVHTQNSEIMDVIKSQSSTIGESVNAKSWIFEPTQSNQFKIDGNIVNVEIIR